MRILLIALHFAEYANALACALSEAGHDVGMILYSSDARAELGEDFAKPLVAKGITLLTLDRSRAPTGVARNVARICRFVRDWRPDIVHAQETGRDEVVAALPIILRRPFVLTVHDPEPHSGLDARRRRFSRGRLYSWIQRRVCDGAITHGEALRRNLGSTSGIATDRVFVVPHGPLGRSTGTRYVAVSDAPKRLLFFGRIHAYKGLGAFVAAIKALRASGHEVQGVIAGRGSDLEHYRVQMNDTSAFEIRDYYIPASEVTALFTEAYAVVLPYTDGTQSGVAAMALGFGVPVVATAVGSIPELVRHGENGLLTPAGDIQALVTTLTELLEDEELHRALCIGAARLRDGDLSWHRIADLTLSCYRTLVENSGKRRPART